MAPITAPKPVAATAANSHELPLYNQEPHPVIVTVREVEHLWRQCTRRQKLSRAFQKSVPFLLTIYAVAWWFFILSLCVASIHYTVKSPHLKKNPIEEINKWWGAFPAFYRVSVIIGLIIVGYSVCWRLAEGVWEGRPWTKPVGGERVSGRKRWEARLNVLVDYWWMFLFGGAAGFAVAIMYSKYQGWFCPTASA